MLLIYLQMLESEADRSKFTQLYETYKGLMFYTANRILKNETDAEDAVHEAFIAILKNLEKILEIDCPKTRSYIVIIVERKALDLVRERRHATVPLYDEAAELAVEMDIPLLKKDGLAEALAKLPPRYREVILLRYANELSTKEIAKALGLSSAAVQKLLWRAKDALRQKLNGDGGEHE